MGSHVRVVQTIKKVDKSNNGPIVQVGAVIVNGKPIKVDLNDKKRKKHKIIEVDKQGKKHLSKKGSYLICGGLSLIGLGVMAYGFKFLGNSNFSHYATTMLTEMLGIGTVGLGVATVIEADEKHNSVNPELADRYRRTKELYLAAFRGEMEDAKREGRKISPEYDDYAKYLKLSLLRDREQLQEDGLKELNEIVQRNEMAAEVESLRTAVITGKEPEEVREPQTTNNITATMEVMDRRDTMPSYHPDVPTIDFESIKRAEQSSETMPNIPKIEVPDALKGGVSR